MRTSALKQKILALRRQYRAKLPGEIADLEGLFEKAASSTSRKPLLEEFRRIAHRLAGSGGTFGYPEIGELGRLLEQRAEQIICADQQAEPAWRELGQLLGTLNQKLKGGQVANFDELIERQSDAQGPEIHYESKSVFVLDDESYMRTLLRHVTEDIGFGNVTEFANGEDALEYVIKHGLPDVILCDIEMEPMGGFDFITHSAAIAGLPSRQIPVVFLTRHSGLDVARRARRLGAQAFVLKPPSFNAIKSRVDHVLTSACQ